MIAVGSIAPSYPAPVQAALVLVEILSVAMMVYVAVRVDQRLHSGGSLSNGVGPAPFETSDVCLLVGGMMLFRVLLILVVIGLVPLGLVPPSALKDPSQQVAISLAATWIWYGFLLAMVATVLGWRARSWNDAFGLAKGGPREIVCVSAAALLAALIPVGLLSLASQNVLEVCGIEAKPQEILALFEQMNSPWLKAGVIVTAVIGAPICEELLFRGVAYPFVKRHLGCFHAIWITSLVFALFHEHVPSLLPLFLLSIVFTLVYEWTGNLAANILMHAGFNALSLVQLMSKTNAGG